MANKNYDHLMGWRDEPEKVNVAMADLPIPLFSQVYGPLKDTGRGKIRLLTDAVRKVIGKFPIFHQLTGDCVSMGAAGAATVLQCIQVLVGGMEEFGGIVATEPIYGGSRIQIGNGALGYEQGSVGIWAAKFLQRYGCLFRQNYPDAHIDLSVYDVNKATTYGNPGNGCPSLLLPYAKLHTVKTVSQVNTYEEARDAIYNGYPVTVASNVGFDRMVRDKDGFMMRSGNWGHQMYFAGAIDQERPGLLDVNSWGEEWSSGPRPMDIPEGSFFVDADTVNQMLQQGDSWVYSNFEGFEIQDLDWDIV